MGNSSTNNLVASNRCPELIAGLTEGPHTRLPLLTTWRRGPALKSSTTSNLNPHPCQRLQRYACNSAGCQSTETRPWRLLWCSICVHKAGKRQVCRGVCGGELYDRGVTCAQITSPVLMLGAGRTPCVTLERAGDIGFGLQLLQ